MNSQKEGVLLVGGHSLFQDGLKEILQKIPDVEVVGEVGYGPELRQVLNRLTPDLTVVDVGAPVMNGLEVVQQIKRKSPEVKILVLSAHRKIPHLFDAFKYGADGYLLKDDPSSELVKAFEKIGNGELYVSPMLEETFERWARDAGESEENHAARRLLTPRRQKILGLIAEGRTSREIASFLGLSPRTIEHHREIIKKRLNLKTTADLVKYALTQLTRAWFKTRFHR